ncbi:MAG: signal recognition particle-docking protein FtsY [Cyanobacteria bacterium P01_A01_bin.135]
MAPFNWFNRNKASKPEETAPAPQAPASAEEATEAAAAAPSPQTEEKLDWAKAAYQMIQKRKTEAAAAEMALAEEAPAEAESAEEAPAAQDAPTQEAPPAENLLTEATPEDTAPAADASESATETDSAAEDAAVEPTVEPALADETRQDEGAIAPDPDSPPTAPVAEAPPEADAATDADTDTDADNDTEAETAPDQPAARPFWAQAEAERQERLEQLKATAIDDTLPEPEDVDFDEDFVWSAGVLAGQGRRPDEVSLEEISWLTKLRQGLGKTRRSLVNQLRAVVGQGPLNDDAVMEIESLLLQADVGIDATDYIIEALQNKLREEALPPEAAIAYLKEILRDILDKPFQGDYSPTFAPQPDSLNVWLLTGVNGAGKTTTIGKLAHLSRQSDYSCLIAAADTFRAAAVEQVKVWGARSGVEVIANPGQNTDPAAVVFDAIAAAQSRSVDVLLVDTAGRLQNKKNLMDELSKIRRIIDKKADSATVESLLVLDATLGQNGLQQAKVFAEAAQLSGVVLTKLDGTAKGGVALAVVQQLGLPIRFIGAGEGIEDLRPFSSYEFVEALLSG